MQRIRVGWFKTCKLRTSIVQAVLLQLTASPWTTEASTRERWQFGVWTNRKSTSSNRDTSL